MRDATDIRLLLVDDDSALLDALSEALRLHLPSLVCETADGAAAALEKVTTREYDAVISDIKMPGMDGLDLLARVRQLRPEIPVLLITGHGETDLAIRALRAGAYDLLQKPLDREYLFSALERAVETRRLRREVEQSRAILEEYARTLEQRVEERTAELQRANEAKDEFLGLVSHELRTPITVILGNADLLLRRGRQFDEEQHLQALSDVQMEARRLQRIVENLLILARPEHRNAVELGPLLLGPLVSREVRAHRAAFPSRLLHLHLPKTLPMVLADATHVELVLRNLLSNAEKYSPPHAAIEVDVSENGDSVAVSVLDGGPGISPDEAESIFTAFYRSPETAQMASGIGIGLAVCKRLVEVEGGQIWGRSRPEGGSEFGFALPVFADAAAEQPYPPGGAAHQEREAVAP